MGWLFCMRQVFKLLDEVLVWIVIGRFGLKYFRSGVFEMSVLILLKVCCLFVFQVNVMLFFKSVLSGVDLFDRFLENFDR